MISRSGKTLAFIAVVLTVLYLLFLAISWSPTVENVAAKDVPGIYIAEYGGKENERLNLRPDGTYLVDYFNAQGRLAYHQGGKWKYSNLGGRSSISFNRLPLHYTRTEWPKRNPNTLFPEPDTNIYTPDDGGGVGTTIYKYHDRIVVTIDPDVIFGYERKVSGKTK